MRLGEIASFLGGELRGNPDAEIRGAAGVHEAGEGEITFLIDRRLLDDCIRSTASCVVVKDFISEIEKPQIIVPNPQYAFARLLELFYVKPARPRGVSDSAFVSPGAEIGSGVSIDALAFISEGVVIGEGTIISPGVFIGRETVIGDHCMIYPNVTIRERVSIGKRVIIHPGVVIGSDGFGYVFEGGRHYKIPQVGNVVIGDDVEIGANVTIDRATTGSTVIGSGTKIDNLVQVGHNVRIGENSIIVAQAAIGGSSELGSYVMMGGQVGVADHAKIDGGSLIGAKSGIMGHVKKGVYSGSPAIPHRDWLKASALFAKLPELHKKIKELEERIRRIEGGRDDRC